jgi:hypothetical protein
MKAIVASWPARFNVSFATIPGMAQKISVMEEV